MSVTVAIPSRGEGPLLRSSVEHAIRAAGRVGSDAEVLVVVNGRDRVPALEGLDSPLLRMVFLDRPNLARARNVGIEEARHDTVLFGDDGAACADSWAVDLADALRDPRFPVVTAPVRVPIRGPVTAFLDYQRFFDAPPVDGDEARTVTGNCGLRRDLLPAHVRFDEVNTAMVAEDVAFGQAARAAGVRIRWLGGVAPGLHLLADRVEEVTDRLMFYGRGTARLWSRRTGQAPQPSDVLWLYRYLVSGRYTVYRRFREVRLPGLRAAFALYDCLLDVAFLVGYLDELGAELGRPVVEVDHDGLRARFREVAARLAPGVPDLSGATWNDLPVDLTRLDADVSRTDDPLVAELLDRLPGDVRLAPAVELGDGTSGGDAGVTTPKPRRLLDAWRELRDSGAPIGADDLDRLARRLGFGYREAAATIERAANRRAGQRP